jgi:hypothetical protein
VNVDCIEFYSERLLAICISQHLNTLIYKAAKEISGRGRVMPVSMTKSFRNFKICKNIDQLHDNLRGLQSQVEKSKRQIAISNIKKSGGDTGDSSLVEQKMRDVKFGALDNFFFYIILDNVKALFKIEKAKKVMEKLAIC